MTLARLVVGDRTEERDVDLVADHALDDGLVRLTDTDVEMESAFALHGAEDRLVVGARSLFRPAVGRDQHHPQRLLLRAELGRCVGPPATGGEEREQRPTDRHA